MVRSFPAGSSGGPDGVRPKHILDLVSCPVAGPKLLTALTSFVNLLLSGRCPRAISPILFGANLIALSKKSGGVRPIAIGYTWRRIAAKCANAFAVTKVADYLYPLQVGVGVSGGCEAAVHATRRFLDSMPIGHVIAKLDFSNAFNSIHRQSVLSQVDRLVPELSAFCLSAYGSPSALKFGSRSIPSCEGVQQGDPLGPFAFLSYLAAHTSRFDLRA